MSAAIEATGTVITQPSICSPAIPAVQAPGYMALPDRPCLGLLAFREWPGTDHHDASFPEKGVVLGFEQTARIALRSKVCGTSSRVQNFNAIRLHEIPSRDVAA